MTTIHATRVFLITVWPTKNAILLVVVQKAILIMESIVQNAQQIVLHVFRLLNATIVWKHFT